VHVPAGASDSGGGVRWGRKMKGVASIRRESGTVRKAALHWYEAHGIGRKEIVAR